MDAKEEIRARLNIEDVIGEYVQLKRAGRNYKGLSPFSSEKTPSFFVSPDKQIWHDFSSNKGGDVFAFIMEVEGMDFRACLEHLARKAGVDLGVYEEKGGREIAERKKRLIEANTMAARYYQQSLLRNSHAVEYVFKKRSLDRHAAEAFQIGYAPDTGSALVRMLEKRGFSKKEMADAGLVNRFGGDMFRGRMMVPLMDASAQVIGFTGRIIVDVEGAPKYLNTPQTLIYDKSRHIFGFSQAKEAIRHSGHAVIVEGNLDVVTSHQVDVREVVATAGTAMTEYHLRALKRLTSDIRLAYDSDAAGVAATERAIGIAARLDIQLSIITLPDGYKDPDELIKADVKLWKQAIDEARPAVDWVLAYHAGRVDITTAAGKRAFSSAALALVRLLSDAVEREHYERKIADMIGSSLESIQTKSRQTPTTKTTLKEVKTENVVEPGTYIHEDNTLAVAAIDPASQELFKTIDIAMFHGEERRALAKYFAAHGGSVLVDTPKELQNFDTYVKIVLLRADTRYAEWDSNDRIYETARLIRQIEHENKKQTQVTLIDELRDAETNGDELRAERLRVELNTLIKEIARGKR